MTDEETKRIKERFAKLANPRQVLVQALFVSQEGKWLITCTTLDDDDAFRKYMRGIAAEGGSLKEALMNLADKINV